MADWQSFRVKGEEVVGKVKELIREGNVRRVVIKQGGKTVAEFPLTIGVVGAVAAPLLAAIGALTALLTECTIEVERQAAASPAPEPSPVPATRSRSRTVAPKRRSKAS